MKKVKTARRHEEFGSSPWAAVGIGVMLAVTVGGAFAPHIASPSPTSAQTHVSAPGAHLISSGTK